MNRRHGITRIETVLLMGMIAIVLAVVGAGVMKIRQMEYRKITENRLKELTEALHACNDIHKRLPPATGPFADIRKDSPLARHATLHVHLLPFFNADALYKETLRTQGQNLLGDEKPTVDEFLSLNDPTLGNGAGVTNFAANLRVFTDAGIESDRFKAIDPSSSHFPYGTANIPRTFRGGTSNTLAFTTIYSICQVPRQKTNFYSSAKDTPSPFFGMHEPKFAASPAHQKGQIFQLSPDPRDCNPSWTPQSFFGDGILVSLCDVSVRMVGANIDVKIWGRAQHPSSHWRENGDW